MTRRAKTVPAGETVQPQKRTQTVRKRPNSTVLESTVSKSSTNVTDIHSARNRTAPDRSGKTSTKYLNPMLKALEHRLIEKPSGKLLKQYAKGGSQSTVVRAQKIAERAGWIEKVGQWKWTEENRGSKYA